MTENKRYYRDFEGENGTIIRDRITNEEVFEFGMSDSKDLCDLLNSQEEEIQRLELIVGALKYALRYIKQIEVEIDFNECGDVDD